LLLPRRMRRAIATLPFVISTGAQRSGEICGLAVPAWECFSGFLPIRSRLQISLVFGDIRALPKH
jgi:hypothetical protein